MVKVFCYSFFFRYRTIQLRKPKFFVGWAGCLEDVDLDVLMSLGSCLEDVALHVLMSWTATSPKKTLVSKSWQARLSQTWRNFLKRVLKSTTYLHKTSSRDQSFFQKGEPEKPKKKLAKTYTKYEKTHKTKLIN